MQGLAVRMARGVNRALSGEGSVFADRYHAHELRERESLSLASTMRCKWFDWIEKWTTRKAGLWPSASALRTASSTSLSPLRLGSPSRARIVTWTGWLGR
jgi:hypothetical protein